MVVLSRFAHKPSLKHPILRLDRGLNINGLPQQTYLVHLGHNNFTDIYIDVEFQTPYKPDSVGWYINLFLPL